MLLEALILASEKAACIARKCREEKHLFQLLIEEKTSEEANPRFVKDFKTLADVLIQETFRHDIGIQYPELKDQIKGEESNVFCNALGESICVEVLETPEATAGLLSTVLNGDAEAARLLSEEVHRELTMDSVLTEKPQLDLDLSVDCSKMGIWIDPIDSTAEYINGTDQDNEEYPATNGLKCVTVLIGVYDLSTGEVIMGIVNQPFSTFTHDEDGKWHGICYWGVNFHNVKAFPSSLVSTSTVNRTNVVCLSGSEDVAIKEKLQGAGFQLIEAAGAGYKMLATIIGVADVYLLSKSSTFKWDCCGPHGILRSLSGDIVIYEAAVSKDKIERVAYKVLLNDGGNKIEDCCNKGGIIAYRNYDVMCEIVKLLKDIPEN